MSNVWALVLASVGGGGLAGVVGTLVTGAMNRPKVRADVVSLLTDSALKQVNELQERTAEAEREAAAARQQIRALSGEVDALLARLRTWRAAILSPTAELPALRQMVLADPGPMVNGRQIS